MKDSDKTFSSKFQDSKPDPKGYPWRRALRGNVLMLGWVSFFTDVSSEMIYPLLPMYFTGLVPMTAAAIYIGLMDGIAESVSSFLKIYSGRLSDAIGKRKPLAVAGYSISTLSRPLTALAAAGWQVIFLRFCDRVGKGIRTSPRDALISESVDPRVRGLAFGFHRAMDHAGAVTGPVLAMIFLYIVLGQGLGPGGSRAASSEEMQALRWLFGLALVPGLAAVAILTGTVKDIPPGQRGATPGMRPGPSDPPAPLPGRFYRYLLCVTLFTLGNSSDLFLVFYAQTRFGFGLLQVVGFWVVLHVSKIVFSLPGGYLSDKLGRRTAIISGWAIYVSVYFGMASVSVEWAVWGLIILYGVYYGLTEGAERALVADFVPGAQRGKAYGLYHGAVGFAALPASFLFGVFWVQLGPGRAFAIGASLALAAMVLLLTLISGRSKPIHT
ncbi:MAG: MFS transporter [Nitrospinaceae bacterium]